MILNVTDIKSFLIENKKIGGILKFVESDKLVLEGLTSNQKFLNYLLYYVGSPLNNFYYYFLGSFEQKLFDIIVLGGQTINLNQFTTILHSHLRERYLRNVYGDEKQLWNMNGKSVDKTISCFLKQYNPEYLEYLYTKNYKQLAEIAFDIYLYFPIFGDEKDFRNFMIDYKKFLSTEWKPIIFENVNNLDKWNYGKRFKVEQIHSRC